MVESGDVVGVAPWVVLSFCVLLSLGCGFWMFWRRGLLCRLALLKRHVQLAALSENEVDGLESLAPTVVSFVPALDVPGFIGGVCVPVWFPLPRGVAGSALATVSGAIEVEIDGRCVGVRWSGCPSP